MKLGDPAKAKAYFGDKLAFTTGPVELDAMLKKGENVQVIDVRAANDFAKEHIAGSINLPRDKWETLEGLDRRKTNVVLCYSIVCHLAAKAAFLFADKGFPVMELEGGFKGWKEHQLPTET